ncbi:hypothetical protein AmDm5_0473 [Acetobacter malorum]|nr:hypothetical protein AmDm5_0473 [Acetobacter malorum]
MTCKEVTYGFLSGRPEAARAGKGSVRRMKQAFSRNRFFGAGLKH